MRLYERGGPKVRLRSKDLRSSSSRGTTKNPLASHEPGGYKEMSSILADQ
jgi:hypothetical protein